MVLRPARVWTSSPIRRSSTRRSPEGVEIFVPFKKQLPPLLLTVVVIVAVGVVVAVTVVVAVVVGVDVVAVAVILCADADFLANPRKGKLAALAAVTLSSCRRVRTPCRFFMGCSPFQLERDFPILERGLQIAKTLISMSIYQGVYSVSGGGSTIRGVRERREIFHAGCVIR
jgi:hypothetical protein